MSYFLPLRLCSHRKDKRKNSGRCTRKKHKFADNWVQNAHNERKCNLSRKQISKQEWEERTCRLFLLLLFSLFFHFLLIARKNPPSPAAAQLDNSCRKKKKNTQSVSSELVCTCVSVCAGVKTEENGVQRKWRRVEKRATEEEQRRLSTGEHKNTAPNAAAE